jgi:hypothetical protein
MKKIIIKLIALFVVAGLSGPSWATVESDRHAEIIKAYKSGNKAAAIPKFEQFIADYPNGFFAPSTYMMLAALQIKTKDTSKAIESLKILKAKFPNNPITAQGNILLTNLEKIVGSTAQVGAQAKPTTAPVSRQEAYRQRIRNQTLWQQKYGQHLRKAEAARLKGDKPEAIRLFKELRDSGSTNRGLIILAQKRLKLLESLPSAKTSPAIKKAQTKENNATNKALATTKRDTKALEGPSPQDHPKLSLSEAGKLKPLPINSLSLLPIKYSHYALLGYKNAQAPMHPDRSAVFSAVDKVGFPFTERLSFAQITAKMDALGLSMKEARLKAESLRRVQPKGGFSPKEQKRYAEALFFPFVRDIQAQKIQILAGIPRTIKGTELAHKIYNKLFIHGDRYLNQWQYALEGKNGRAQLKDPLTQQRSDYVSYNTRLMLKAWKVAYYREMDSVVAEKFRAEGAEANLELIGSIFNIDGRTPLSLLDNRHCLYADCSSLLRTEISRQVALGSKFIPGNKLAESTPAFKAVKNLSQLTANSFTSKGLNYETELMAIYLGDFKNSRIEKNSQGLSSIFNQYIRAYGKYCDAFLPSNKVAITSSKCATERVTKNGFGTVTNTSCVRWVEVPTGLYADPKLYSSNNKLSGNASKKMLGKVFSDDPFASRSLMDDVLSLGNDMSSLVQKKQVQ